MSARWRPLAAVVICFVAALAVLLGVAGAVGQVAVAAFLVLVPGLLLVHVLRIADPLLGLVLTLMTGPVAWILVTTVAVFVHVWHPSAFVVVGAVVLGLAGIVLSARTPAGPIARPPVRDFDDSREIEDRLEPSIGKSHRGAFPSPYEKY